MIYYRIQIVWSLKKRYITAFKLFNIALIWYLKQTIRKVLWIQNQIFKYIILTFLVQVYAFHLGISIPFVLNTYYLDGRLLGVEGIPVFHGILELIPLMKHSIKYENYPQYIFELISIWHDDIYLLCLHNMK